MDGAREAKFCMVGELDSTHFPRQVANFIFEIHRVKQLIKNPQGEDFNYLNNFQFTQEQSGISEIDKKGKKKIKRTHGIIVNAIAKELEKHDFNVGNDKNRDLFTYRNKKIINLFEIKTSSKTHDLYTGIGQLLIYSIPIENKVNLYLVRT